MVRVHCHALNLASDPRYPIYYSAVLHRSLSEVEELLRSSGIRYRVVDGDIYVESDDVCASLFRVLLNQ